MTAGREKILVIQLAKFGDFLQTTPLISALRKSRPDAAVSVLVDTGRKSLAEKYQGIDHVPYVDLSELKKIAGSPDTPSKKISAFHALLGGLSETRYDRVINLNTSRLSALIGQLIPAEKRQGPRLDDDPRRLETSLWANFIMRLMENRRLNRFNLVDLYRSYAGPVEGKFPVFYPVAGKSETSLFPEASEGPVIGFQAGSRHPDRRWPEEKFADLARLLIVEKNATVVLLGTTDEKPVGRKITDIATRQAPECNEKIIDLMGRTSVDDLARVLCGLDALVTGDTGTMHLASAMQTRILALFMGPAWCHETGPYGDGHLVLQASPDCAPCREGSECPNGNRCRSLISPELAYDAVMALIDNKCEIPAFGQSDEVRTYRSIIDNFGVAYLPTCADALDQEEIMALAWREAGRGLISPEYRSELTPENFDSFTLTACFHELEIMRDMLNRIEKNLESGQEPDSSLFRSSPLIGGILAWLVSAVPDDRVVRFVRDMEGVIDAATGRRRICPKELSKFLEKYYNESAV